LNTTIFIPKTIKVGYQNRNDTYTKKLAYIIYYDQKNVLRKQKSWEGWRDKNIEPQEFVNEPTSGFVLNKKTGDYKSDWHHRKAYIRVYDPRNFEFEITVENLLFILENTSSIKGKGLEGQFIYGWSGKDLILIPTESPDYKELVKYNEIIHEKNYVKVKDLVLGGTYKTKSNEEYIYMGRFDYYKEEYDYNNKVNINKYGGRCNYVRINVNKGKHHYFVRKDDEDYKWFNILVLKSLGERFIEIISSECVDNYADLFDKLECDSQYSPVDNSKDEYISYTIEEFNKKLKERGWFNCYDLNKKEVEINKIYNDNMECYCRYLENYYSNGNRTEGTYEEIFNKFQPMYKNTYLTNGKLYSEGK